HPIGGTLDKMIDGRRTKSNRGIVHKNAANNVNRDLDNQNFDGVGESGRKHLTGREVERLLEATKGGRNEARDRCLLSGRRRRTRLLPRWPPSASRTARAVFPHAALAKTQRSRDAREGIKSICRTSLYSPYSVGAGSRFQPAVRQCL